jgi:hypothetical protein
LDDGVEFENGRYLNERDVEYFCGHSGRILVDLNVVRNC